MRPRARSSETRSKQQLLALWVSRRRSCHVASQRSSATGFQPNFFSFSAELLGELLGSTLTHATERVRRGAA